MIQVIAGHKGSGKTKRLIDIANSTPKTEEALMKRELPAGVEIEIKLEGV